ncbi:MAG: hypothetical protein EBZ47_06265 [Chlamydiae bacterium]|nr:hypothetical protein [Chlamydiota bacterium]
MKKFVSLMILFLCHASYEPIFALDKLGQEDHQLLDSLKKDMPSVVYSGPLAIANLNMNQKGSVILVQPGEKVFGMLNFSYESESLEPESLNQIVIGFSQMGAQKCIFNELGYRCNDGIASFFLQMPENPGIYEVQCRFEQAYSPSDALNLWDESENDKLMKIGKVIVR